ncbi:MAG: formate/nitrite transporter family protein [Candidatus Margulisbacteria bacterium]|nr:formate/nitrite transporter family protein [Candidatus Margulisiibacteriota bacterium]MBU1022030.1 formate/nitrite transporter family protein [Candidatus Margulisiibacteriota bacterium]MBU1729625.1 formate/nitrite transporter family protein [Candidatus Margulisiibacteriota bacterium]MBU1954945.1 formate/nitrite transporter family protein [Candidatus Margulisiibacteriota bacterium]
MNIACKTPANVADTLSKTTCVAKTNATVWKLVILGILAGIYIAFGAAIATLVATDAAQFVGVGLSKFFIGAVFSVGLMLVVIAGAELFTGNNLMLMSALDGRVPYTRVVYKWIVVYIANFLGSVLMAWLMLNTGLWKGGNFATGITALNIANAKVNLLWGEAFTRAILCNVLVCLAVWMALASNNIVGRIWAIFFPIMTFVALGFEHCIANMYFIPLGILLKGTDAAAASGLNLGNLNWGSMVVNNLIPVTLGNMVGGALVVGLLYWLVYVKPANNK